MEINLKLFISITETVNRGTSRSLPRHPLNIPLSVKKKRLNHAFIGNKYYRLHHIYCVKKDISSARPAAY